MEQPAPATKKNNLPTLIIGGSIVIAIIAIAAFLLLSGNDTDEAEPTPTAAVNQQIETGTIVNPPREVSDFTFINADGQTVSLSDFQGQYVMIYFGYIHCPDACPTTMLDYRTVKRELGDLAENMAFTFISVDPERDTPEIIGRFVTRYDADFIGLQGDHEELARITDDYGLIYGKREIEGSETGYLVDHTATKFLVDPQGQLIRVYSFGANPQAIADDLRELMQS